MESYEKLLEEAFSKIKKTDSTGERFEIPKVEGHFEGKKTIITNFLQIASQLRRAPEHIQKYLLKEVASYGEMAGERLILNKNVPSTRINEKIEQYAKEFVICKECKKPDTEILKDGRISFLHCQACGAKHPITVNI